MAARGAARPLLHPAPMRYSIGFAVLVLASCAGGPSETLDTGPDAGSRDSGPSPDSGRPDSGAALDSGTADGGVADSGLADGGVDSGSPHSDAGASSLSVAVSFEGDYGLPGPLCDGGCAYRNHPDMSVAANGVQVVEVTGQNVTVFDYSGSILHQTPFASFMSKMNLTVGKINDPRLTYDPFISKWIIGCSCSNDYLMVSNTSDATGSWTGYTIGVSAGDLTMWPGWDANGVYVSEFQFGSAPPYPYAVVALDPTFTHKTVFTDFPYESRPATDPNRLKKATDPAYFVARDGPLQNGTNANFNVLIDSVSWNGTTATKGTERVIPSGFLYNTPVDPAQPSGPPIKSLESHRAFGAAVQNGHLHTVISSGPCTTQCGAQGMDSNQIFFWFDVDLATMTLAQSAKVSSANDAYLFPSIAADVSGNVGMVATAASASTYASVVLFGHRATDPLGFVSPPLVAASGTHAFTCNSGNPVGWGTYTHAYQDPADPTRLWAVEEYGASPTDCQWHTRVLQFTP
jgi:hypothetical protein